jgi:hypothetical protein
MKKNQNQVIDTAYPKPNRSNPARQEKSVKEEEIDDDDPLFEEDMDLEMPEEEDEDEYEINDRFFRENMDDIREYMTPSL